MSLIHSAESGTENKESESLIYYQNPVGPDQLCAADSIYSNRLDKPVLLRSKPVDSKKFPPMSLYTMFKNTVDKGPNNKAIAYKSNGVWCYFTYTEYFNICIKAAKSFIKLGLGPSECVTIIGFNSPQWFISCLGAILSGGVSCGIYTTNTVEACEHILNDCKSPICVVENKTQLDKILKCIENGNTLIKTIVQYEGTVEDSRGGLVKSWTEFIDFGDDVSAETMNERIKTITPNKCSTLIYTSGTTGNPKAAMISHDCMSYLVRNTATEHCKLQPFNERFVSYLPLSHIAAQSVDIYCSMHVGGTTYFAQPDALKGTLTVTLQEARPTFFFAVPRVYEKMQDKLESTLNTLSGLKLYLINWARRVRFENIVNTFKGQNSFSLSNSIAQKLFLNKIHQKLGLDQCRTVISAAAPITKETLEYFISIGFPIVECYGMSETTGPHSVGLSGSSRVTSVGPINQYNRSKIVNKDEDGSGELCIYGRHVFMGYLNSPQKTEETFDSEDWLHTGDIAKIDSDGFLYITGRLKELIITAGGENIAPIPIEDRVKSELSDVVSNCMLVGDKKKYLVLLVTLKSMINLDTQVPQDELTQGCIEALKAIGSNSTKVSDIVDNKDSIVYNKIEKGIKNANLYSTSRAAKVQKFAILPVDFSLANGELGPTLKLRRQIVLKMYSEVIEKLYAEKDASE